MAPTGLIDSGGTGSDPWTGDQVAVRETDDSTQVVTEDGESATLEHPDSTSRGQQYSSSDSSDGADALDSGTAGKAAVALLGFAALARRGS